MQIIKPGKLNFGIKKPKKVVSAPAVERKWQVWDDFAESKNKKKEYQMGDGNRMLPKKMPPVKPQAAEEELQIVPPLKLDYGEVEKKLQHQFKNKDLLMMALTHRSALNFKDRTDYERLEFVGDAVLDLGVAHLLCDKYPDAREGDLSKMRAALVNTQALSEVAKILDLGSYVRMGRSEKSAGGHQRISILADITEAVIGAIYLDSNFDTAFKVVKDLFVDSIEGVTPYDPKTELQEALHTAGSQPPEYLLELVEGPEHSPVFVSIVIVDGEVAGRGRGQTKKASQQGAAAETMKRMVFTREIMSELAKGQKELIEESLLINRTLNFDKRKAVSIIAENLGEA